MTIRAASVSYSQIALDAAELAEHRDDERRDARWNALKARAKVNQLRSTPVADRRTPRGKSRGQPRRSTLQLVAVEEAQTTWPRCDTTRAVRPPLPRLAQQISEDEERPWEP